MKLHQRVAYNEDFIMVTKSNVNYQFFNVTRMENHSEQTSTLHHM